MSGTDMVNSPDHYNQSSIECIDSIRAALGEEGFVAYCRGNAIKYNWRAGYKFDSDEDLKKAAWYSRMAAGDDPRLEPGPALKKAEHPLTNEKATLAPKDRGGIGDLAASDPADAADLTATLDAIKDVLGFETPEEVRQDLIRRGYGKGEGEGTCPPETQGNER